MKIKDIATYIKRGITPQYTQNDGIPVINQKCIKNGVINKEFVKYTSKGKKYPEEKRIRKGDILINSTGSGTLGRVAYVNSNEIFSYVDSHVTILRCKNYESKFLYYWLRPIEPYIESLGKGSTNQLELSSDVVSEIDIPDFPLKTQEKIASILSAYDDLIENNRKQIKLLEEAAQRLYKEWFVDLRFPGHETTAITDGIPEGWARYKFSEIASIMSGGTPKTDVKEYYDGNIPFYTPKDSDGSFFAFDTITHISKSGLDHCNSQYYPSGTVIITARGTVGKTTILAVPMAMNQSCYALKCDELNSPYYLFFSLNKEVAALKTMANGGVFNTIIVKTFDSIHLTVPTHDVLIAFDAIVSPTMDQIKVKMQQNVLLAETRDRLLPKLMSGEMEV